MCRVKPRRALDRPHKPQRTRRRRDRPDRRRSMSAGCRRSARSRTPERIGSRRRTPSLTRNRAVPQHNEKPRDTSERPSQVRHRARSDHHRPRPQRGSFHPRTPGPHCSPLCWCMRFRPRRGEASIRNRSQPTKPGSDRSLASSCAERSGVRVAPSIGGSPSSAFRASRPLRTQGRGGHQQTLKRRHLRARHATIFVEQEPVRGKLDGAEVRTKRNNPHSLRFRW